MQKRREEFLVPHLSSRHLLQANALSALVRHEPSQFYYVSKRLVDIVLALIGIVALIPLFLMIAVCIKLDDGGTIFYRRKMVGRGGRPFWMLKFRTMIPHADAYLAAHPELMRAFQQNMKLAHDPRVTRMGRILRRFYVDELPQLFNVLLGQMSLVGPRAIHECELKLYGAFAQRRHTVRPGLTGLWQISPNRHECYEDRIPLDMYYVDRRSFLLDLAILFSTLKVLIARTGL